MLSFPNHIIKNNNICQNVLVAMSFCNKCALQELLLHNLCIRNMTGVMHISVNLILPNLSVFTQHMALISSAPRPEVNGFSYYTCKDTSVY
jgi:hypothetical protein